MRRRLFLFLCVCLLTTPQCAAELNGTVSWVYDGDTLRINNIGKVRLLGIDCPEDRDSPRDRFYQDNFQITPERLRAIARQAKRFNIEQVKGQRVRLEFDQHKVDPYGRQLVYLYLQDGRMLNRLLLEKGLASVFRRYSFRLKEDFLTAEATARKQQLGLWQQ